MKKASLALLFAASLALSPISSTAQIRIKITAKVTASPILRNSNTALSPSSQTRIKPENSTIDPRLAEVRARFQNGDRSHRRLDTSIFIDAGLHNDIARNLGSDFASNILKQYLREVGAEPLDGYSRGSFRLEMTHSVSTNDHFITETIFLTLYDLSSSQGSRAVLQSKTEIECKNGTYNNNCIFDERPLREAFLRLR